MKRLKLIGLLTAILVTLTLMGKIFSTHKILFTVACEVKKN